MESISKNFQRLGSVGDGADLLHKLCYFFAEGPTLGLARSRLHLFLTHPGGLKRALQGLVKANEGFKHIRHGSAPQLATFQRLACREGQEKGVFPGR